MNTSRGLISTIVLIVAALITMGVFHISFRSVAESPTVRDNLLYAWQLCVEGIKIAWEWLYNLVSHKIAGT